MSQDDSQAWINDIYAKLDEAAALTCPADRAANNIIESLRLLTSIVESDHHPVPGDTPNASS